MLNKDILNRLLSNSGEDVNAQLMTVLREMQTKNSELEQQVALLTSEKVQLETFASQQAQEFAEQIKQLQEQSMNDQERSLMKEQILLFQQKLSEKETKYIKLDNELRTKKKEVERLQKRLDEGAEQPKAARVSNHQNTIEFDELMNTSIDAIT